MLAMELLAAESRLWRVVAALSRRLTSLLLPRQTSSAPSCIHTRAKGRGAAPSQAAGGVNRGRQPPRARQAPMSSTMLCERSLQTLLIKPCSGWTQV